MTHNLIKNTHVSDVLFLEVYTASSEIDLLNDIISHM